MRILKNINENHGVCVMTLKWTLTSCISSCRLYNNCICSKGPTSPVGSILIKVITSSLSSLARHHVQRGGGISQLWDYVHQSHIHHNIPLWLTITGTKNISAHKTGITERKLSDKMIMPDVLIIISPYSYRISFLVSVTLMVLLSLRKV